MKRIFSFVLVYLTALILFAYSTPLTVKAAGTAEWSVLWLIIPEIDAVVDGTTYKSSMSSANITALSNLASTFESDVESAIKDLNDLTVDLKVTQIVSALPIKRVTGTYTYNNVVSHFVTAGDISEILDAYAPLREGSYDSLIVMGQFQNVPHPHYAAMNLGWMSWCPAPLVTHIATYGYNLQLHEMLHQMEGIANGILGGSGTHPSPDALQTGNYLDIYLKGEYPGVQGEAFLTKFYFEMLAGTLPTNGTVTSGFQKEYWGARPTKSRPSKVEFSFTGSGGSTVTREYNGAAVTVGADSVIKLTYDYDIKIADDYNSFVLDLGDGMRWIFKDDIAITNNRVVTVDLAKVNGGPLEVGRNYYITTYGRLSPLTAGSLLNPNTQVPFTVGEGGASSAKNITVFTIPNQVGGTVIGANTVSLTVPYGTDITSLIPVIAVSAGASVSPASGVARDFTSSAAYVVTAEDGTTKQYTVTVTVSNFGHNPPTGIPDVTGAAAAMYVLLVLSVALWGYIFLRRRTKNG